VATSSDSDDTDTDTADEQVDDIECQMKGFFAGMVRNMEHERVRCHLEYCDRLAQLSRTPKTVYATADSGADTNVLGQEWLVVAKDTYTGST
jgi:hypothetical protein